MYILHLALINVYDKSLISVTRKRCVNVPNSHRLLDATKTAEPIEMLFGERTRAGPAQERVSLVGMNIGATSQIRLNNARASAMRAVATITTCPVWAGLRELELGLIFCIQTEYRNRQPNLT